MEMRAASLAITSASPLMLMLSVSVSLANGLKTFQSFKQRASCHARCSNFAVAFEWL